MSAAWIPWRRRARGGRDRPRAGAPHDGVQHIAWRGPASASEGAHAGRRSLEVRLTPRARTALAALPTALDIELELYFSCLIRKRVNLQAAPHADAAAIGKLSEQVSVSFRPVMTRACAVNAVDHPDLAAMPLVNAAAFTPRWLTLDHVHGAWRGEFGW